MRILLSDLTQNCFPCSMICSAVSSCFYTAEIFSFFKKLNLFSDFSLNLFLSQSCTGDSTAVSDTIWLYNNNTWTRPSSVSPLTFCQLSNSGVTGTPSHNCRGHNSEFQIFKKRCCKRFQTKDDDNFSDLPDERQCWGCSVRSEISVSNTGGKLREKAQNLPLRVILIYLCLISPWIKKLNI